MSRAERGLPANPDAERMILGSILLDGSRFASVFGAIDEDKFALEKHRRIFRRMADLSERGESIDRVTVANELLRREELESVDGLSYLVSLDDGLPQISNLDSYIRIIVEKWRLRRIAQSAQHTLNRALLAEDPADLIGLDGQASLSDTTGGYGGSNIESAAEFVSSYPGGINRFLDPSHANPGISTGLTELDEITSGGFHAGEIFLIGARPGAGKSAIGSCIAKHVARNGTGVVIYSLELSKSMYLHRLVCEEAGIGYSRFRRGDINDEERARLRSATGLIMDLPIYIDDTCGITVADARVKLNAILRHHTVGLAILDYAQLFKPPKGQRFGTENDKFYSIGEGIKAFSKDTGVPTLLLSQLNRMSEASKGDDRPKLSQCRGAGVWEEIAYYGACIYREFQKKPEREDLREVAKLLCGKNRSGPETDITLRFVAWLMRFSNRPDLEDPPHVAAPPTVRDPSTSQQADLPVEEVPEYEQGA